jgi:hypothetical protein
VIQLWELLAKRVNALPLIRAKLREPLTGSDLVQITTLWKNMAVELQQPPTTPAKQTETPNEN